MRRFLLCSGINGRPEGLSALRHLMMEQRPEGILFAGGVLSPNRRYVPRMATEVGLTREDSCFLEQFFETLGQLDVFAAVIPGLTDIPLENFLRMGMHAEVDFPSVHLVHATLVQEDGVAVCGLGSCIHEWTSYETDSFSRTMAEYYLRSLWTVQRPHTILLLARPPQGPLGGAAGSALTAELIDSFHPGLCVVGGPSERRGTQRFASTLVVNPGNLADCQAALLDWNRAAEDQVELLHCSPARMASVSIPIRQ